MSGAGVGQVEDGGTAGGPNVSPQPLEEQALGWLVVLVGRQSPYVNHDTWPAASGQLSGRQENLLITISQGVESRAVAMKQ